MPLSPTPRLAFGLNTRPPRSSSRVNHLASLLTEAFGYVIGTSFGPDFLWALYFLGVLFFSPAFLSTGLGVLCFVSHC